MGIIKKLLGRELVGGTVGDSTEVYPITHVGAVYDSEGKTLEEVIADIQQQIIDGTGGGGGGSSSVYPINYLWAYKASENTPVISDPDLEAIKPTGWSQTPEPPGEGEDLYMTTARKQGSVYLKWSNDDVWSAPVRISGGGGTSDTGADGDGYNYIYCLTTTENVPNRPSVITVEAIEQYEGTNYGISTQGVASTERINVWRDHPNGVAPDAGFEWIAVAKSDNGTWGDYSTPTLWSKYGFDGKDGDSIEYIYKLTATKTQQTLDDPYDGRIGENGSIIYNVAINSETYLTDDFIPYGWHDNPLSLSVSNPVQWVSVRKSNNGVWEGFSTPTIWSENSITETIVDAPYVVGTVNDYMVVMCDYQGTPIVPDGTSYDNAYIRVTKGSTNVTDQFTWDRSNCSATNVSYNMRLETNPTDSTDKYLLVQPYTLTEDKGKVSIVGVYNSTNELENDSTTELIKVYAEITLDKFKASQPGVIPPQYSFDISLAFAINNGTSIVNDIVINAVKTDYSNNGSKTTYDTISEITSEGLSIYVKDGNVEKTLQQVSNPYDNVLNASELTTIFSGKNIADKIELILKKGSTVWDHAFITYISSGGTTVNNYNTYESDDYIFTLKNNNRTVALTGTFNTTTELMTNEVFEPDVILYQIVGSKAGVSLNPGEMQELFPIPAAGTLVTEPYWDVYPSNSCTASIVHNPQGYADGVYIQMVPRSTTTGSEVTINCFRKPDHTNFWGTLVATYNLERSSYSIAQNNRGLTLSGLSDTVNAQGERLEQNESLLTHTSKQLTSTIESQNVFSNLFGFTNGLTFDNSEPFIQGYGAEIIPGATPSGISGFNVDITQNVVISMDVYRSGSGAYTCNVLFNNKTPEKVTVNGEDVATNGFSLNYNDPYHNNPYHVVMYFEELNSSNEGLYFTVTASGNSNRMIVSNLKVEYGYTPTKFCISDNDAAVNNNHNLLNSDMSVPEWSTVASTYSKTSYGGYDNVHCFVDATIESGNTWLLYHPAKHAMATDKLYTLSFLAKSDKANTHIESIAYIEPDNAERQLGNYTYINADTGIFNSAEEGMTVHTLTTEWKKYCARFYVSSTALPTSDGTLRPVLKIRADNSHPAIDFNNGGSASDTRSVYITNIVFQEGYTPSDDLVISDNAHTKSLINQTSSLIELSVENRMLKSGITLTADGVTINATKVAFTGAEGKDYIRLGQYNNGAPYFVFLDPNGDEIYRLGYQNGLERVAQARALGWISLDVKALNGDVVSQPKDEFTAQEMYEVLFNTTVDMTYAKSTTYYRYIAAKDNSGNYISTQGNYDGLYYENNTEDGNDLPVSPTNYVANSDMWWAILNSSISQSGNATIVTGYFAIFYDGNYKTIPNNGLPYAVGVMYQNGVYKFYNNENNVMNTLSDNDNVNVDGVLDLSLIQKAFNS